MDSKEKEIKEELVRYFGVKGFERVDEVGRACWLYQPYVSGGSNTSGGVNESYVHVERVFVNFLTDIQSNVTTNGNRSVFTVDMFVNMFYKEFIKTVFDNAHNNNNTSSSSSNNNKDYTTYAKRYAVSKRLTLIHKFKTQITPLPSSSPSSFAITLVRIVNHQPSQYSITFTHSTQHNTNDNDKHISTLTNITITEPTCVSFLNKHFPSIECDTSLNEFSFTIDKNNTFYYETPRYSFFKLFIENIDDILDANTNELYINFEVRNPSNAQETMYFLFTFHLSNDMKLRLVHDIEKYLHEISIDGVGRKELLEKVLHMYFKESKAKIMAVVNKEVNGYEINKVNTMPQEDKDDKDKGCVVL
jgi:hypothetical protein